MRCKLVCLGIEVGPNFPEATSLAVLFLVNTVEETSKLSMEGDQQTIHRF